MRRVKVKVVGLGKWGSVNCQYWDGRKEYLKPSKKVTMEFVEGREYDVDIFHPEGKKTVYITKAVLVGGTSDSTGGGTPSPLTPKPAGYPKEAPVATKPVARPTGDKPTQEYWENKDAVKRQDIARSVYLNNLTAFLCTGAKEDDAILDFNRQLELGVSDWESEVGVSPQQAEGMVISEDVPGDDEFDIGD